MEPKLLLAAGLLVVSGSWWNLPAELDLAPRTGVYFAEATPFPCVRFRDGSSVVRFMPPQGWRFTADGARCSFHPVGVAQASGTFSAKPRPKEGGVPAPERLQELLAARIPAEATGVEYVHEGLAQVKLETWPAMHAQVIYEHFGQKFRAALLIVTLEREELHIRFGARAADFDRVFTALLESLGTFTWNPTDEDPPEGNKQTAAQK
jgi:hypothetical protein